MAKQAQLMDWQIAQDEQEWLGLTANESLSGADPAQPPADRHRDRWLQIRRFTQMVLILALLGTAGGYWTYQEAQQGVHAIEKELADVVEAETWQHPVESQFVATDSMPAWQRQLAMEQHFPAAEQQDVTVQEVVLNDGRAMVFVRKAVPEAGPDATFQATRFYQETAQGWLRIGPDRRFWGPPRTLETDYFRFSFYQKDAAAVHKVAAQLDSIYATLHEDLGLWPPRVGGDARLTIEVTPAQMDLYDQLRVDAGKLLVPSPLLIDRPDAVSAAELLTQSIVHPLVSHLMRESLAHRRVHREWTDMLLGIQYWQAYAGSDSLAGRQAEMVAWLYVEQPAMRQNRQSPTVADLARLCRGYHIWGVHLPLNLSLKFSCEDEMWQPYLLYAQPPRLLATLLDRSEVELRAASPWSDDWMRHVALTSVVDYLVVTYGRATLPALLDGMERYETWEELLPAVVGVSAGDFEAGWQQYLADAGR